MNREDIIKMAREADMDIDNDSSEWGSIITAEPADLERFAALVAAAERERNTKEFPVQFGSVKAWEDWCESIRENERKTMIEQGWRQCAKGQRTTQFCGMVEQAVQAEREACAKLCLETEPFYGVMFAEAIRARQ